MINNNERLHYTFPKKLSEFAEGALLLVDKPQSWTSFDVVNKIRVTIGRKIGKLKVGHAGTLDPLATGLLIICTGKLTKQIDLFQAEDKEYTGTFRIGAATASYDSETPEEEIKDWSGVSVDDIVEAANSFTGDISQIPPVYSAVKVDGQRAYNAVRNNLPIELKPRNVHVSRFEILDATLPDVSFLVACSKGTYIRTLVHDVGRKTAVGAYMTSLRRTKSGNFNVQDAFELNALISQIDKMEL